MLQRGNLDVDQCKKPSLKHQGRIVAMSARALKVLPRQVATLERSATILPLEVPAIELAQVPCAAFSPESFSPGAISRV